MQRHRPPPSPNFSTPRSLNRPPAIVHGSYKGYTLYHNKMENQKKEGKEFVMSWENLKKEHRTYMGLVPLLEDAELNCQARILFHIISSFSYVDGYCFATNEALVIRLGLQKGMIKRYLNELQQHNLIEIKMIPWRFGFQRQIHIRFDELKKRYAKKSKKPVTEVKRIPIGRKK